MSASLITEYECQALTKRKLSEESCQTWEYAVGTYKGNPCQIANYRTPDGSRIVAQKVRMEGKEFCFLGNPKEAGLYGQWKWRDGGKMVVITEGEIDAISVSQMQGHKWPVVSIPNGANGARKSLQAQLEWLERFETVVLMFDMDEPGQQAARECAELFTPGKCKIAHLDLKDANDMLKAGRGAEIINAIWGAKEYRPDGIVAGVDLWDELNAEEPDLSVPYHWSGLQKLTLGRRRGEIVLVTAGSGIGKSAAVAEIAYDGMMNHGEALGYIALEENRKRTGKRMMSLYLGKKLHISREGVTPEQYREAFLKTVGNGRFYLYDHWGSCDPEGLMRKIRYMVKGLGCSTIVLDHISIVVSGIEDGDERRLIDNLMTQLRTLVEELQCRLILVCHLRKASENPHEEGGRVTLDDLRGSGALKQLCDIIIGLERNQQDEVKKLWTRVRVLKNRFSGETGHAGWLRWDAETGRLCDGDPEFEEPIERKRKGTQAGQATKGDEPF